MMKPRFSGKISDRKLIETFKQSSTVKILSGQGFSDRLLLLFSDFLTQHPITSNHILCPAKEEAQSRGCRLLNCWLPVERK
ncbi:MAG: hypothetical protein KME55_09775 [Nostoc indistinguendum CM1-VF10]|jgi:hypothetical protein|nr:hypothetical protein [Nostoc indistinguendum CM1-VF10]